MIRGTGLTLVAAVAIGTASWAGCKSSPGDSPSVRYSQPTTATPGAAMGNLLKNPGFEESTAENPLAFWQRADGPSEAFSLDHATAQAGQRSLRVSTSGFCLVTQDVSPIPAAGTHLVLSGHVKTDGGYANLWINCVDNDNQRSYVKAEGKSGVTEWIELKTHMMVPKECVKLQVWLYFTTSGTAWFDNLCLRGPYEGEELPRSFPRKVLHAPGIACAEGCYEFTAHGDRKALKIAFPIPQMYDQQAPIYFEVVSHPSDAIKDVVVRKRQHAKPNWIAEVQFKPLSLGEQVRFSWKEHVLVIAKDYGDLPERVKIPMTADLPVEVSPWLRSTRSVQADDEDIKRKAVELRDPEDDLIQTIRNVIEFSTHMSRNIKRGPDRPRDCSALTTLHWGEICTGSANLAAALLRANGIPARLLANYPIWNTLFYTHYYVEVYIPTYGWTRAESIMNIFPVETFRDIIVSVVYPADEDKSFDRGRWCAPGCPYLSLTEPVGNVIGVAVKHPWGADHVGAPVVEFEGSPQELRRALELTKEVWTEYLEHCAERIYVCSVIQFLAAGLLR